MGLTLHSSLKLDNKYGDQNQDARTQAARFPSPKRRTRRSSSDIVEHGEIENNIPDNNIG